MDYHNPNSLIQTLENPTSAIRTINRTPSPKLEGDFKEPDVLDFAVLHKVNMANIADDSNMDS